MSNPEDISSKALREKFLRLNSLDNPQNDGEEIKEVPVEKPKSIYECGKGWTSFVEYKVKNKKSIHLLMEIEGLFDKFRDDSPHPLPDIGALMVGIINKVGPVMDAFFMGVECSRCNRRNKCLNS